MEKNTTPNPVQQAGQGNVTDIQKFKGILEYFVKHMANVCIKNIGKTVGKNTLKYKESEKISTLKPVEIKKGYSSGQGYKNDKIQQFMEEKAGVERNNKFSCLSDGDQKICISIYDTPSSFMSGSYLHLVTINNSQKITNETAGTNINPVFEVTEKGTEEEEKNAKGKKVDNENFDKTFEFVGLEVGPSNNDPTFVFPKLKFSFNELGLGTDDDKMTEKQKFNLQTFFNYFIEMRRAELMGPLTRKGIEQLLATHNMILTGAPGTGKTWSAKNIASWIICGKSYEKLDNSEKLLFKEQCELVQFHPSYDYTDFVEGLRPIKADSNANNSQQGGQSAQSSSSKEIGFELKNGVFIKFCEKALPEYNVVRKAAEKAAEEATKEAAEEAAKEAAEEAAKEATKEAAKKAAEEAAEEAAKDSLKAAEEAAEEWINSKASDIAKRVARKWAPKYVFIIDEINRGELSKIFGELFYSIDPGYRGVDGAVLTQYANMVSEPNVFDEAIYGQKPASSSEHGHFFIPDNVYIIGTMNDIDRSVESMDFAMRRRFSFIEVKANEREDMWTEDWKDLAKACMEAINEVIGNIPGLSSAYHIGPAYFNKLNDYEIASGGNDFFKLWNNHLYGVIFEYLRGKKSVDDKLNEIQTVYLKALCDALNSRFNYNGMWGKILINKVSNANNIDSSITDEKSAKKFLDTFYLKYDDIIKNGNRDEGIMNLNNEIKRYMAIGKKIEKL